MKKPHIMKPELLSSESEIHKWQRVADILNHYSSATKQKKTNLFFRRLFAENLLVFFLQYMGLTLSTVTQQTSPLWLASGTACAFMFLRGPTVLPGIWLGSIAAYYFANAGGLLSCECATILGLQAQLLLVLCYRYISPTIIFYRPILFFKFTVITALLTALITLGLVIVCDNALPLWLPWWLANFNGILILACALVTWDAYFPEIYSLKKIHKTHFGLLYGAFVIFILIILLTPNLGFMIWIGLAILILHCVIAHYYGWCGSIFAASLFGFILFAAGTSTIFLQVLLLITTITGLFTAISQNKKQVRSNAIYT